MSNIDPLNELLWYTHGYVCCSLQVFILYPRIATCHVPDRECWVALQVRQFVLKLHRNVTLEGECLGLRLSYWSGVKGHVVGEAVCVHHRIGVNRDQDVVFILWIEKKTHDDCG